jgi:hypothetical protein
MYECPVCYDKDKTNGFVTPKCGHLLCLRCYTKIIRLKHNPLCPYCRKEYIFLDTLASADTMTNTGASRNILDIELNLEENE